MHNIFTFAKILARMQKAIRSLKVKTPQPNKKWSYLKQFLFCIFLLIQTANDINAQVVINEGTNRNYLTIADEDGEYNDWIELYNAGNDTVNLFNYSLTDKENNPTKWVFPNVQLLPGEFKTIFCSGKDRKPISGFIHVINTGIFNACVGWNEHLFSTPFNWDGVSNLLVNTCSYSSLGYTTNSVFNQTTTPFLSTVYSFQDGSDAACYVGYGTPVFQRPNMKLNDIIIGTGTIQNSNTEYPAPYGNWYWGARNQMLILASEMIEAGLTAGEISSISFDVAGTDPNTIYDYIDIHLKLVSVNAVSSAFEAVDSNNFLHTNFKISKSGETIYLFSPEQVLLSSLFVNCNDLDNSTGSYPDSSPTIYLFQASTPSASNNASNIYSGYLNPPIFSLPSGVYNLPVSVGIVNPNAEPSEIYFTLDGSDPTTNSTLYNGIPIIIGNSKVLKARAFANEILPSPTKVSSYFSGISNSTPILSVITDNTNLYGPAGIFDNWQFDWERNAFVEYFDSTNQLIFSQNAGIQVDGGWGGSRSNPQHSFRVELDDGVLGDGPIDYQLIPNRPERTKYGKFYLRNGSNQYLSLPYKDACQVEAMAAETNIYYSAWRPVSVYINASYFGLYELREKFDQEYFEVTDNADPDSTDILSLSAWYGGALRAVAGNVDSFFVSYAAFNNLNCNDTAYWSLADQYFDMSWYTDYIIGQSWMGNSDWPWNNIKIYRSDKTNFRWRFCIVDIELAMAPNGWTDCYFDHIQYMMSQSPSIPYINIWLKSMQNERYRNYFINRYADVMNTAYDSDRISAIENSFYNQTVIEMPTEYARWGDPNIGQQMLNFYNNHLTFQNQLSLRSGQVRNHILSNFSLPNQVEVMLNVYPEGAGKIQISTITPEIYPWEGIYFNGIPVKIEAIANEGFSFAHWGNNGLITDTLNAIFLSTLNAEEINFEANFGPIITKANATRQSPSNFSLYPNPASDNLYLKNITKHIYPDISYKIVNLSGKIIKKGILSTFQNEFVIDIRSIPVSIYLLKLFDSNGTIELIRFVKIDK
jgi:hypothetical protein